MKQKKTQKDLLRPLICSLALTVIAETISFKIITQGYIHLLPKFELFLYMYFFSQSENVTVLRYFPVLSGFITVLLIKDAGCLYYRPFLVA